MRQAILLLKKSEPAAAAAVEIYGQNEKRDGNKQRPTGKESGNKRIGSRHNTQHSTQRAMIFWISKQTKKEKRCDGLRRVF